MSSWPTVSLGKVCEFKYGKSLPASKRSGGAVPVYGSNGVVGGHSRSITSGPTIVVGRKGSFGEVHLSESSCWPIDTTYYIDESSTLADLKWLHYLLRTLGLKELNRAAAIPGLNREDAYRKTFPLPPLEEQQRIAAILDQADAVRAKRRQALDLLTSLPQVIFHDMFVAPSAEPASFALATIGDLTESTQYGTSSPCGQEGAWTILRMGNVTDSGELDLKDLKYADLAISQVPKYAVRRGDMLFNRTNSKEKVGKSCVVRTDRPLAIAGYLLRVRFAHSATAEYVSAFLGSPHGKSVRRRMAKAAVNQANINASEMRSIPLRVPPLTLQEDFEQRVAAVLAVRDQHAKALNNDDQLFSALQARAFRGEL